MDPAVPRSRDLHAVMHGVLLVGGGSSALVATWLRDHPTQRPEQLATFGGWMLAVASVAGGAWLVREGLRRQVYATVLRWVFTAILLAPLVVAVVGFAFGAWQVASLLAQGGGEPSLGLREVPIRRGELDAPQGWKQEGRDHFSRGSAFAGVGRFDTARERLDVRGRQRIVQRLDAELGNDEGVTFADAGSVRTAPVRGMPTFRATMSMTEDGITVHGTTYSMFDARRDRLWVVAIWRPHRGTKGADRIDRSFLQRVSQRRPARTARRR